MANVEQVLASSTLANTALSGATELACVTLTGITVPYDGVRVWLQGYLAITPPGSTTSVRAQIRRGSGITGTVVADTGLVTNGPAASAIGFVSVAGVDGLTGVAQGSYTLTVLCTAGSGAGTVNFGSLAVVLFA